MALVFLSYDRDDAVQAKRIAVALKEAGHTVWWDDLIKGGSQYANEIEQALKTSDVVMVLWSSNSIKSAWVRDEAAAGRDRGCLVPVLLDGSEPPLGFRQFQNIDLSRWNGRGKPAQLLQLLEAIPQPHADGVPTVDPPKPVEGAPSRWRLAWMAVLAIVIVTGAWAAFRMVGKSKSSAVPTVAVVAGNNSVAARDWARDVLVGLGSLEGGASRSFRLIDESEQQPDLVIEVIGAALSNERQASLVLRSAVDRSLLWSREFKRPESSMPDLQREVVGAGALILQCAQKGLSGAKQSRPALLKQYLGGCWSMLGSDPANLAELAKTFGQLTQQEPAFENAWAGLLLAEAEIVRLRIGGEQGRKALERHIAQARKVNPQLPEIYLAQGALLPPNDVVGRIRLATKAVELDPDNAHALMQRSFEWMTVGRMTAAMEDGMNAVRIQPFSPWVRDMYVYSLQGAGQFDDASKEIDEAARLWPRADQLWYMRLRSNYAQGDPAQALALAKGRKGAWYDKMAEEAMTSFLEARINPSERNVQIAIDRSGSLMRKSPEAVLGHLRTLAVFGRTEEMFATMPRLKGRPDFYPGLRELYILARISRVLARPALDAGSGTAWRPRLLADERELAGLLL